MSKKNLTVEEQLARVRAIQNRVIDVSLGFAPRGIPKRLLRAFAKGEIIATKYPTMDGWILVAADGGTGGKTQITSEVFIAVLAWQIENERLLNWALRSESL